MQTANDSTLTPYRRAHLRLQASKRLHTGGGCMALLCLLRLHRRQLSTQRLCPALCVSGSSDQLLLQLAGSAVRLCSHHIAASGCCSQAIGTPLLLGSELLLQRLQGAPHQGGRRFARDALWVEGQAPSSSA